jgi:hypothetical protein
MVLTASRFVTSQHVVVPRPAQLRRWVVSAALDRMSVESLQALIILAFNDVSLGRVSFVGSPPLTSSVDRKRNGIQGLVPHRVHDPHR